MNERKCKIPRERIVFNPAMHRWEVYSSRSVTRAGELQPVFVSASFAACEKYKEAAK